MKSKILLSIITISLLASCSSVYKSGQTPDDVYYSPVREIREERKKEETKDDYVDADDNYLRMRVKNNNRWSRIDDFNYWYDSRYSYTNCNNNSWNIKMTNNVWNNNFDGWDYTNRNNCNCTCNNSWNNNWSYRNTYWNNGWNNWNNGFYVVTYKNPTVYRGNTSGSNITAFKNRNYSNTNIYTNNKGGSTNNNGNNGFGNLVKKAFSSGNNSSSPSWDRPARTFDNNSSSSSKQPTSDAGGKSGGYNSTGTSSSGGRGGKN